MWRRKIAATCLQLMSKEVMCPGRRVLPQIVHKVLSRRREASHGHCVINGNGANNTRLDKGKSRVVRIGEGFVVALAASMVHMLQCVVCTSPLPIQCRTRSGSARM
jgi:hypothetical protein